MSYVYASLEGFESDSEEDLLECRLAAIGWLAVETESLRLCILPEDRCEKCPPCGICEVCDAPYSTWQASRRELEDAIAKELE